MRAFVVLAACLLVFGPIGAAQSGALSGEWRYHGADSGSTHYSGLDQINRDNVGDLSILWRWRMPNIGPDKDDSRFAQTRFETTPIMAEGVLYFTTGFSQVFAVDAASGQILWQYDPESWKAGRPTNLGFVHRGPAYWSKGDQSRILFATGDAHLIALDAKSGKPCADFGENGKVDLTEGLRRPVNRRIYSVSSPPIVCGDVVAVGSSISDGAATTEMPPGDVRGFDVLTGKQLWAFHSIAQPGEVGNETWEDGSWEYTGNANVWTLMSADPELDTFYLPFGTPTNDWYGGHRKGGNVFAESLVCVRAKTGERVWHFQCVHHGLWDYDLPAAPTLVNISVDGKPIRAVAQVSKQGFCYVLDRATGEPVWPIEERDVPQSNVPGEKTSLTQPFPTKPAAFERQGMNEDNLIDFTPELLAEAKNILAKHDHGPLFTPPSTRGTYNLPGWVGGANWSGAAFDPEAGKLYVPSLTLPVMMTLVEPDKARSNFRYVGQMQTHVDGPQGLPLIKPPYSRVTAIDLNTGEHAWMRPLGEGPTNHPALKNLRLGSLGSGSRGFPLVTKSLLFVAQEGYVYPGDEPDPFAGRGDGRSTLRAFDKDNGDMLFEMNLPANCSAHPMTYAANGRQYIVLAIEDPGKPPAEVIALGLP